MCVCVQLPRADRALRFSIENASKQLHDPAVVYLATLKAYKHGLLDKPLSGAVFMFVARRTALPATNAVRV